MNLSSWRNILLALVIGNLLDLSCLVIAITPYSQIEGLEFLFNATNGTHWSWKNESLLGPKWSFTSPQSDPCVDDTTNRPWQGVSCSSPPNICRFQNCEILSLQLPVYQLDGTLPPEFFIRMTSLTKLQLTQSRQLIGTLPSTLGSLINLRELFLYSNKLTGTLPSEIGLLTRVTAIVLYNNLITGTIPLDLMLLTQLIFLQLYINELTGSIPTKIGMLTQLTTLYLDVNRLTGPIPTQLSLLTQLRYLSIYDNKFTGTISSTLSSLSHLIVFELSGNKLSGTIPSSLNTFSQIDFLDLGGNYLSGTLPSELSALSQLKSFTVAFNQLTGGIPSEFNAFNRMEYFSLQYNQFTGTLPSSLFNASRNLIHLSFSANHFSGTIPSDITLLTNLEELHLDENTFTGTIPSSIINLKILVQLHLYENHLHGEINFQLDSLPNLEQLFLQQNHFHGHLLSLFSTSSSTSNSSTNHPLMNIDVSDNQFSDSIPSQLFLYPHLQSISLSLNCFQHELPSSMCEAVGVEVISMDGLGSSKHCPNLVRIPFTSVSLVQSIEGSIPNCVWSLSNLKTLNLAGNGLSGSIGKIASMSSLLSLTLSHNYLSGTIPLWLQEKNMSQLDLSHNKLMGRVDGFKNKNEEVYNEELVNATIGSKYVERSLKLSVNRLSGDLSHSFDKYSILDILSGNLFGCDYTPSNDENSDSTICGSEEFDQSMIVMGGACGLILILVIFYGLCLLISFLLSSSLYFPSHDLNLNVVERMESQKNERIKGPIFLIWIESRLVDLHSMVGYLRYYSVDDFFLKDSLISIRSFGYFLSHLIKSVCLLIIVSLIFSLPIYILKVLDVRSQNGDEDENGNGNGENNEQSEYITHSEMYRWLWTMSFVSGTVPSVLLMVMAWFCLMIFCLTVNGLGNSVVKDIDGNALEKTDKTEKTEQTDNIDTPTNDNIGKVNEKESDISDNHLSYMVWMIFVVNIAIVGTANALYLWSILVDLSTNTRILIQFSFGVFTFVWRGIILSGVLPIRMKESKYGVWLFTCLNIVNNVLIPCVVTALSNPSCYQRLLIPPDDISSTYTYSDCQYYLISNAVTFCALFGPEFMSPLKIAPPFSYSYQCGSTILVSYIPVYMYAVSLQLLSVLLKWGIIYSISSKSIQIQLMKWLSPINFPLQVVTTTIDSSNTTIQLIKPYQIISIVMNNLILLLSFGLCSPVLGCYITLNICVTLSSWLILVGRFVNFRLDPHPRNCHTSGLVREVPPPPPHQNKNNSQGETNPILSPNLALENKKDKIDFLEENENRISLNSNNNNNNNNNDTPQSNENSSSEEREREGGREDEFLTLLNLQLQGVNSSLLVCKWPIVCTSCLFVTLLCWDMVGDEVGWFKALWVPGMGVGMLITLLIWDHFLTSQVLRVLHKHKHLSSIFFFFPFSQSSSSSSTSPSLPSPSNRLSSVSSPSIPTSSRSSSLNILHLHLSPHHPQRFSSPLIELNSSSPQPEKLASLVGDDDVYK